MKIFLPTLLLLLTTNLNITAQNLIAVQNGGTPAFYTNLQVAVANAQSGDTIYIPGGGFDGIAINKKLHLIGVGHNPDSTSVTASTIINSLSFDSGADGSSIYGVSIHSNIYFNANINNLLISRCYLPGEWGFASNPSYAIISNLILTENFLASLNLTANCINSSISNNIFSGQLRAGSGCIIKNNIILGYNPYGSYPYSFYAYNCVVENNIFYQTQPNSFSNCIFRNNINYQWNGPDTGYSNQGFGNIIDWITLQTIFVNYDPATMTSIYKEDFHLLPNSPYKNAGHDGTDIGIYGGTFPWKEGSIPFNPHFQAAAIAPKTDNTGNLNVQIKVTAQDN